MVRNEIRELGWIPPSQRLNDTLARADQFATEQRHRELMLEHVVLGLTDDTDAARVLEANGVAVARFRDFVMRYVMAVDFRWPPETVGTPMPDTSLKRIFDVASAAAETSGRKEIDGALLVAAIIGEGTSNAATMLQQHGLNVDDDDGPPASEPQRAVEPTSTEMEPAQHQEQDLNDVHRMLSTPIDPPHGESGPANRSGHHVSTGGNPVNAVATSPHASASASPHSGATPQLQRTRPKTSTSGQNPRLLPKPAMSAIGAGATQVQSMAVPGSGLDTGAPRPPAPMPTSGANTGSGMAPAEPVPVPTVPPPPVTQTTPPQRPAPTSDTLAESDSTPSLPPVENLAQIDADILGDILPAKMRLDIPEIVEIRVLNSDIDLLTGQVEGRDVAHAGTKLVSRSLSLRLRSPNGAFSIEARSPEVQWINANDVIVGDEATSWRWQITGQKRGVARLQLLASARIVASDGTVLETAMPEQSATVKLKRGFGATFNRLAVVSLLFLSGCAVGLAARPAYRILERLLLG